VIQKRAHSVFQRHARFKNERIAFFSVMRDSKNEPRLSGAALFVRIADGWLSPAGVIAETVLYED
jgi:hypothetical protein